MRTPTGTIVTACALFLQPAAARGPDPFIDSTATSTATPPPVIRTPQPASPGQPAPRSVSGGIPGLYGGTPRAGSCDVQRQIGHLTADQGRAQAFARTAGISPAALPGYLRGLTSVVLRADTRVTDHGYRDGGATSFQSVLEAGTAVLVDNRGVPRVRCACGNPLAPPVALGGHADARGRAWSGYRPAQVIVVTPTAQVITNITIVDVDDHTWIERPIGHQGPRHDHLVPPPRTATPTPAPTPRDSDSSAPPDRHSASPSDGSAAPFDGSTSPQEPSSPSDCTTPTVTVTPDTTDSTPAGARSGTPTAPPSDTPASAPAPSGRPTDCPTATATATVTASPPTAAPDRTRVPPGEPSLPDDGATMPDDPDTGSVFGSPTDVFDS